MVNNSIALPPADGSPSFLLPHKQRRQTGVRLPARRTTPTVFFGLGTAFGPSAACLCSSCKSGTRRINPPGDSRFSPLRSRLCQIPMRLRKIGKSPCGASRSNPTDGRCMRDGDFIYIYGADKKKGGSFLARAPETALDDFAQWRFYSERPMADDSEPCNSDHSPKRPPKGRCAGCRGLASFRGDLYAGYFRRHRHANRRRAARPVDRTGKSYSLSRWQTLPLATFVTPEKCTRK